MESQSAVPGNDDLAAQAASLRAAETAASARARVPAWYWVGLGVLAGAEVFAVSWGVALAISLTALAMLLLGRLLTYAVGQSRGIKIGKVFGGAGNWVVLPWFAVLVALAVGGRILTIDLSVIWPGVVAALLGVGATALFGYGYDRIRLHRSLATP